MWDLAIVDNQVLYAGAFIGHLSFLLAIVIGGFATYFVFSAAKRMGGGLFGSVLNYVGIGMTLIVVGTIAITLEPWLDGLWVRLVHTCFFALGFIFLVLGAEKLLKGINTN